MAQSVTRRAVLKKFGARLTRVAPALTACLLPLSCLSPPFACGAALAFDGTGGYVSLATTGSLSGTFTVELWAKPNSNSPSATLSVLGSRRPVDFSFDIKFWQGNLLHSVLGNRYTWITTAADAPFPYATNTWYHLAEVVTATNYTLYVDGAPVATGTYLPSSPLLYNDTHELVIGNLGIDLPGYLGDEYMNGLIDEVRIWNTARTASQLRTNAFRTLTGSEPGLMGYWPLEEGSGTTTADASGHGFIGTIVPSSITGPAWVDSRYRDEKKPSIIRQPESQSVQAGANVDLSVSVFGGDPLSYQWKFNSNTLPAATNATLALASVGHSASGEYTVLVSNQAGSVLSQSALVTVIAPHLQIGLSGAEIEALYRERPAASR